MSVKEIADYLKYPLSSTSLNVNILESCDLIDVQETINSLGKSKLCSRNIDELNINLFKITTNALNQMKFNIPIGNYVNYSVKPVCGIATPTHTIGIDNDENVFFNPERYNAGLIWFTSGFLEYRLSNKMLPKKLEKIQISFEVCSEAPFYRNDWKSDITVCIEDIELGTWTSLGDFGGRTGKQNPKWWPSDLTQYGVLTNWEIKKNGTFINNVKINDLTINDLNLKTHPYITIKIGVKDDAKYKGGINLFGSTFGDYKQDIAVTIFW
jgi:predicted transcriptional regulator